MHKLRLLRVVLGVLAAASLASACASGGGGGGGPVSPPVSPPPPPPPPPSPPPPPPNVGIIPDPNSAEFLANWGPDFVNAEAAWARGYTGAGALIGVIDDGVHPNHPELLGRVSPASIDIVAGRNELTTDLSHGSELSSLIAGNFNNAQTVGIAYEATILAIRADNGVDGFEVVDLTAALNYAVANNVDIVNFSLGGASPMGPAFEAALTAATNAGVIVIVSAGNEGQDVPPATQPIYPALYATNAAISNGLIIAAGGLNPNGTINTVSNPPSTAANWYLTAPAWEVIVPDYGPAGPVVGFQSCGAAAGLAANLCRIQGTSYASPQIAAGIALLMQASPAMTPQQIVDLVLTTALDAGAAGTDSLYGRGIFDIARAFQPVGPLAVATANGGEVSATAPIGVVGQAYGDAFHTQSAWVSTAFDAYGRAFDVNLAHGWSAAPAPDIATAAPPALWRDAVDHGPITTQFTPSEASLPDALARRQLDDPSTAFRATAALGPDMSITLASGTPAGGVELAASGHAAFAGADIAMALTRVFEHGRMSLTSQSSLVDLGAFGASRRDVITLEAVRTLGAFEVSGAYGVLTESGALLGTAWDQTWGAPGGGVTQFFGARAAWRPILDVELSLGGEIGRASFAGGWLSLDTPLITSTARAAARWDIAPRSMNSTGALILSVTQPLRVEQGVFAARLPQSDAWGRAHLAYDTRFIEAAPSGREIETMLSYWLWSGGRFAANASLAHRADPGHRASAPDTLELQVGLRLAH